MVGQIKNAINQKRVRNLVEKQMLSEKYISGNFIINSGKPSLCITEVTRPFALVVGNLE